MRDEIAERKRASMHLAGENARLEPAAMLVAAFEVARIQSEKLGKQIDDGVGVVVEPGNAAVDPDVQRVLRSSILN